MVKFIDPQKGIFINRYKRFFTTIRVGDEEFTCYCPNTGKMSDILNQGNECIISRVPSTISLWWQAVCQEGCWVGVNTFIPNKLVQEILHKLFPKEIFKREVQFQSYRADFANSSIVIEVKHVHWKQGQIALFPD